MQVCAMHAIFAAVSKTTSPWGKAPFAALPFPPLHVWFRVRDATQIPKPFLFSLARCLCGYMQVSWHLRRSEDNLKWPILTSYFILRQRLSSYCWACSRLIGPPSSGQFSFFLLASCCRSAGIRDIPPDLAFCVLGNNTHIFRLLRKFSLLSPVCT